MYLVLHVHKLRFLPRSKSSTDFLRSFPELSMSRLLLSPWPHSLLLPLTHTCTSSPGLLVSPSCSYLSPGHRAQIISKLSHEALGWKSSSVSLSTLLSYLSSKHSPTPDVMVCSRFCVLAFLSWATPILFECKDFEIRRTDTVFDCFLHPVLESWPENSTLSI
jgi:hypothetical protein